MATQLQFRRYTSEQIADIIGKAGEIFINLDDNSLVIHDGETAGGNPLKVNYQDIVGSILNLDPVSDSGPSRLSIGSTTWPDTTNDGIISELRLYKKNNNYYSLKVNASDNQFSLYHNENDKILSADDENNLIVENNLHVKGNITFGADGGPLETITINANFSGNIVPDTNNAYDLGSSDKKWKSIYAHDLTLNNLTLDGNTISSTDANGNIILDPNGTGKVEISTNTSSYTLPTDKGTAGQVLTVDADATTTSFASLPVATASTQGIASFSSDNFTVSNGAVIIKDSGISNGKLANSSITIGTTSISLGSSSTDIDGLTSLDVGLLTLSSNTISSTDANGNIILDPNGTGKVQISTDASSYTLPNAIGTEGQVLTVGSGGTTTSFASLPVATTNDQGIASFSSDNFNVANGVVTIKDDGISNDELIHSSITIGTTSISLGSSSTDIDGLTSLDVDHLTLDGNNISSTAGDIILTPTGKVEIGTTGNNKDLNVNGNIRTDGLILDAITATQPEGANLVDDIESDNKTNTYIQFMGAGAGTDWAYLRQIGGNEAIKLSLDFFDNAGDARFSIRSINSATSWLDTITEVFTVNHNKTGINNSNPQYNLDVGGSGKIDNFVFNNNTISSTNTNGNIILYPNGTGKVEVSTDASSYTLPTIDGAAGQAIITDGQGTTSFQDISTTLSIIADGPTASIINLLDDSITISGGSNITTSVDAYGEVDVSLDADINVTSMTASGDIEVTSLPSAAGIILKSPDESRWRLTVDNTGNLVTTKIIT